MADYLLIESRDPFEFRDTVFCTDLARRLADTGNRVTIFLVQNGVLPARGGASAVFPQPAQAGVEIFCRRLLAARTRNLLRAIEVRHQTVCDRSRHRPAGRGREGDLALGGQDG